MEAIFYIFSRQMKAIVFLILQIFFAARAVLKIGEYTIRTEYSARPRKIPGWIVLVRENGSVNMWICRK